MECEWDPLWNFEVHCFFSLMNKLELALDEDRGPEPIFGGNNWHGGVCSHFQQEIKGGAPLEHALQSVPWGCATGKFLLQVNKRIHNK